MSNFSNKVIWITGASSGIGQAMAQTQDYPGVKLVLSARNEEKLNALAQSMQHAETMVLPMDLEQTGTFAALVDQVVHRFGRIDVLVNNGGVSQRGNALDTKEEVERQIMEVNYFGNVTLSKAVLPQMRKQGKGQLVIMSSIVGKFGFFLRSTYAASKHALHGYYESLRLEEEGNGILVTLVCPGKINTAISENALHGDGQAHGNKDRNQTEGMDVNKCAEVIWAGVKKEKLEILVGGRELKAVKVKRLFPRMFHRLIRKQSPT